MQEIKFRAWDKQAMKYGGECYIMVNADGALSFSKNLIVEQYTGLKDKNGKEIYEGDICRYNGLIYLVQFEDGCFEFYDEIYSFGVQEGSELIGNIHENPDLIDGPGY